MDLFGLGVPRPFEEARRVVDDRLVRKGMIVKMRSQGISRLKWARVRGDTLHLHGMSKNCIDLSNVSTYKRVGPRVHMAGVEINFGSITLAMATILTIQDFSERYEYVT